MEQRFDLDKRGSRRGVSTTLGDVARAAGVSVSTAGRVLRDEGWPVDGALRDRVRAAAAELAYVPNVMARTLRAGAPALVGLVVGNMLDPYYGEIAEAVTRYAETTSKMLVMVCNMQRDPVLELKYCRRLWEHRVAGLILAGGGFDQITHRSELESLLEQMARSGVVITTLSPRGLEAPVFCVDNEQVGCLAATELIEHGHRRIGVLIGPIQNKILEQRLRGMIAVFEEAGVVHRIAQPGFGPDSSAPAIAGMLEADPDITGIIAASNAMSVGVISAVRASGRSVPDDISIVGIAGRAFADWSTPELTRVDLDLDACGRAALDFIAERVVAGAIPPENPIRPPHLVRGGSVASVKGKVRRQKTEAGG